MRADSYVKSDLTEYLKDRFNINLYDQLIDEAFWEDLFDPMEYFTLLYSEFDFFRSKADDYLCIKQHYSNLKLSLKQKYFFLHPFNDLLYREYYKDDTYVDEIEQMSIGFIKKLYDDVDRQIFPLRAAVSPIITEDLYFVPSVKKPQFEPYIKLNKNILPYKGIPKHLQDKYTFLAVDQKLQKLDDFSAKIDYLIDISAEYQHLQYEGYNINKQFVKQCEVELEKIKAHVAVKSTVSSDGFMQFKLTKKCSKIDLIRLLNAMWELKMLEDKNGQIPTKSDFMNAAGKFYGIDLSTYEADLSQAFSNGNLETNTKIFDKLKEKTESIVHEKLK